MITDHGGLVAATIDPRALLQRGGHMAPLERLKRAVNSISMRYWAVEVFPTAAGRHRTLQLGGWR